MNDPLADYSLPVVNPSVPVPPRPSVARAPNPKAKQIQSSDGKQFRFDPAQFPRQPATLPAFLYLVEIVGLCNLRCPSCPVGGSRHLDRPSGFMPVEMYEAVLDKIVHESPGERTSLALYNWGEPLLHPELPKMIRIANDKGLPAGLSSNLVHPKNLKEVIQAKPATLRVSVSGYFPETYNQTHVRGDVNLVKSNLYRLRSLMDRYHPDLQVGICYHLYRHNFAADLTKFKQLADELGFELRPVWAIVMNIEKLLDYFNGHELTKEDRDVIDLLLIKPEEQREVSHRHRSNFSDCVIRRDEMVINHDGTVPLCCGTYAADKTIAESFLNMPHRQIQQNKYQHRLCGECQSHSLHISGQFAGPQELSHIAKSRMREMGYNIR